MKRVWTLGLLFLVSATLVACGDSSSKSPGGDATQQDGLINGDSTQPNDLIQTELPPPPKKECESDDDCAAGKKCDCAWRCREPGFLACEADKNCGGDSYCDPCMKMCYKRGTVCEPCNTENSCNPYTGQCVPVGNQCAVEESRCLDFVSGGSFCGRACLSDAGCPLGYKCLDLTDYGIEYSQCVPLSGSCSKVKECDEDTDCQFGFVCNNSKCAKGCEKDTECANGMVCTAARCVQACDPVNNPCPEGQECTAKKKCMVPGGCADAYDCPEPETYCNPDSHMCEPGCMTDQDCKTAAKVCEYKTCVKRKCDSNDWCSFGEVCTKETAECVIPPEPFCEPCEKDEECGPAPAKCVEFQDEEGTSKGKYCLVPCYDDPANPCPVGYECTNLEDQDGNVTKVCARTCYEKPVGIY